jgi:hypothetical protein
MRLICDGCAHVYTFADDTDNPNHQPGARDGACSASEPGLLREMTLAEIILVRQYDEQRRTVKEQARMIRKLEDERQTSLL